MSVHSTLQDAIGRRRCVRVLTHGQWRDLCPHALGYKDGRRKVLTFQFLGGSASGLAPGGAWRCFFLDDISSVTIIDGPWHTGPNHVAKTEACLDRVECEVRY